MLARGNLKISAGGSFGGKEKAAVSERGGLAGSILSSVYCAV